MEKEQSKTFVLLAEDLERMGVKYKTVHWEELPEEEQKRIKNNLKKVKEK